MESQLVRPNGDHQQEHKLSPEEDDKQQQQQGQGHDKISVLKKVKAKARKLKDTIAAKHAHLHEQGQEHDRHDDLPDVHDLDEEENNEVDEVMVTDSEVHASPINEPMTVAAGAGLRSGEPGQVKNPREEVGFALVTTPDSESRAPGIHRVPDRTIENFLGTSSAEEDWQSRTRRTDPSNYQTKVYDPTGLGSEEADVSPLIQSIGKMTIEAEPESGELDRISSSKTKSHDQFSPETIMKSIPAKDESEKRVSESSYTERISSVTAAIMDKATSAKDVVVSKLGSAAKDDYSNAETGIKDHANAPAQGEETSERPPVKGITAIVTEKLSPVYEKVVGTGSVVVSKVRGGGGGGGGVTDGKTDESSEVDTAKGQDKGVSVKEYMAEKLKPGEEDKALSELISETARSQGVAGAVGGAIGYLLGKSGQPSPQPQASSGSCRPDKGEHQSEDVAKKSEGDLDMGKGA